MAKSIDFIIYYAIICENLVERGINNMNKFMIEKIEKYLEVEKDSVSGIKINYYLETIISEMEKLLIIVMVFSIFGYFYDIALVMGIVIMLRPYIGGTHENTFVRCLIKTALFGGMPILIAEYLSVNDLIQYGASILMLLHIIMFAPVTSKYRPEYKGIDLLKIKLKGMVMVIIINCLYQPLNTIHKVELMVVMCMLLMDSLVAKWVRFKS